MERFEGLKQTLDEVRERRASLLEELKKLDNMDSTIRSWLNGSLRNTTSTTVLSHTGNTDIKKSLSDYLQEVLSESSSPMKASSLLLELENRGRHVSNVNVIHTCLNRYRQLFERTNEGWVIRK